MWRSLLKNLSRLTIISKDPAKGKSNYSIVKCSCGTMKSVKTSDLTRGKVKSCGCLSRERKTKGQDVVERNRKSRAWNGQIKAECLSHYGPDGILQCSFLGCEVCDIDMLTLDHVNNDGAEDRKTGRNSTGVRLYWLLKREDYPSGFSTLCCNHQSKKELLRRRMLAQNSEGEKNV